MASGLTISTVTQHVSFLNLRFKPGLYCLIFMPVDMWPFLPEALPYLIISMTKTAPCSLVSKPAPFATLPLSLDDSYFFQDPGSSRDVTKEGLGSSPTRPTEAAPSYHVTQAPSLPISTTTNLLCARQVHSFPNRYLATS